MVDKQTRQMVSKTHLKEEKWGRHVGKNPRLGSVSSNRHLRYQLARRLHHSKAYKNVNPRRRYYKNQMVTMVKQPLTTRDKLKNIWNSVKLLFASNNNSTANNDDVFNGFEKSGISSNDNVHYSDAIAKRGSTLVSNTTSLFTREDSSRSTIDTTLEYMPVQQENVPLLQEENSTTHGNTKENRTEEDPRDEIIAKLKNQVALLKKKVKYAREKNTLYKSLLDEANIGTTYLESRRHIKNLVRDNMKPESELPPSPERKVYPLVTSSPIRQNLGGPNNSDPHKFTLSSSNASHQNSVLQAPPQIKSYYSKYPKLPHTESLIKREPSTNHENIKEQQP